MSTKLKTKVANACRVSSFRTLYNNTGLLPSMFVAATPAQALSPAHYGVKLYWVKGIAYVLTNEAHAYLAYLLEFKGKPKERLSFTAWRAAPVTVTKTEVQPETQGETQ
jgi:hypothetical protein